MMAWENVRSSRFERGMHAELPVVERESAISILQECRQKKDLEQVRSLHAYLCQRNLESHSLLGNHIVPALAECGNLPDAQAVFDRLPHRSEHSWTSLISGYCNCGDLQHAFHLLRKMRDNFALPSSYTFVTVLNACARMKDIDKGRELHVETLKRGLEKEPHVGSALVDMYGKCGLLTEAHKVLNQLLVRNSISWTALLAGYAEQGLGEEVLNCYKQMQLEDVAMDAATFVLCLKACGIIRALETGQELHYKITERGWERELNVGNTLVDMYAKCGSLGEARQVFDKLAIQDMVSWTALLAGYAEQGTSAEVLNCFKEMQVADILLDAVTLLLCLKSCGSMGSLETGRSIHTDIVTMGYETELLVGNTLVDMYGKCGALVESHRVFNDLSSRTAISWTALIAGYADNGFGMQALACYKQMQLDGVLADAVTYVLCLKACAIGGALEMGQEIHAEVRKTSLETDLSLGKMLIEMYGKCGAIAEARAVFDELPVWDVESWTAIIKAYGENHEGNMAVRCFEKMQQQGIKPHSITFICVLAACSHASLVDKGQGYFKSMRDDYHIEPTVDHYACMVDLFARSGFVFEAERFLAAARCASSTMVLTALLSACKIYGKVDLGERYFEELVEVDQADSAPYLLMVDIYASAGMWNDAESVRELRKLARAEKKPGSASIEVDKQLHEFLVHESHREYIFSSCWKRAGYIPYSEIN